MGLKIDSMMLIVFRGIGQVIFQENALSGAIMLAGIFYNSVNMGLYALLGTAISTLTAWLLGISTQAIRQGLYGFNGTLVGIGVALFFAYSWLSLFLLVVACMAVTYVARAMNERCMLPGLTAPFVLVTWGLLGLLHICPSLSVGQAQMGQAQLGFSFLDALSFSFGQIMLQGDSLVTGGLFLGAIACNASKMACNALLGCVLALGVVFLPAIEVSHVNNGLFGYNSILAFLAIACVVPIRTHRYPKAMLATGLAILLQWAGLALGLTTLTAPFVLAVWCVVGLDRYVRGKACRLDS